MKKSMKKSLAALAGGAMLMVASFAANANLITNGNFISGSTAGWSASGAVTVVPYSGYGMSGSVAGSLNGAVFGNGDQAATGVLSQAISTVAGVTYALTFNYGSFGYPSATQSMRVSVIDALSSGSLFSTSLTTVGSSYTIPALYTLLPTYTFTAVGASTLLSFSDISLTTISMDGFLTNVAVNQGIPVPVPGTLALLSLALVGWSVSRRRVL